MAHECFICCVHTLAHAWTHTCTRVVHLVIFSAKQVVGILQTTVYLKIVMLALAIPRYWRKFILYLLLLFIEIVGSNWTFQVYVFPKAWH